MGGQVAVFCIPLQQSLLFQKTADAPGDALDQVSEFIAGLRLYTAKPGGCSNVAIDVDAIKEVHVDASFGDNFGNCQAGALKHNCTRLIA